MSSMKAEHDWKIDLARLNDECRATCAAIATDDQPNKLARQCRAQLELVEAVCPNAPPRTLFELYEVLQDMWEAEGPLEALEVVSLEMQLEAVDAEIERRDLRQQHKIFVRTRPRRRAPWVRSPDDF